jgi:hypothetical protein
MGLSLRLFGGVMKQEKARERQIIRLRARDRQEEEKCE